MKECIRLYDFLASRKWLLTIGLTIIVLLMILAAAQLTYKEDIFDFLPQDKEYTQSMQVYSALSEASHIVVIFEGANTDTITQAIDDWAQLNPNAITDIDVDALTQRLQFIYANLPYFLSEDDYRTLETVYRADNDTLYQILLRDKQILAVPGSSFLRNSVASDPLQLIPIAHAIGGQYAGAQTAFSSFNGYMMTAEHDKGFAFYISPYGSTETKQNARLVDTLTAQIQQLNKKYPTLNIRLLGAPVIAVGNARQIKTDATWALVVSVLLIAALLLYAFPRKRDIALIFLAVGFGWLTGLAALYLFVKTVSLIVLGIGAILIGICVNYPLHILVHQRYTSSVRQTLEEVLSPLIIGNITTAGAFLTLIPLHSPALRQLGIFASCMLIGTIFFCVIVLPHLMSATPTPIRELHLPTSLTSHLSPLTSRRLRRPLTSHLSPLALVLFIALSAFVALRDYPLFDANISHINYMTEQQKADFEWFESLSPVSNEPAFMSSSAKAELNDRIERWNTFWQTHDVERLASLLDSTGKQVGFKQGTFQTFINTLQSPVNTLDLQSPSTLASVWPGRFDTEQMNKCVANSLTDNFNYIGIFCSVIVLIFLCLSFKSIKIGLVAFLPMLLCWVFIVFLMQCFGLQFNIVNIILATFIFGQGDDYTIFVVEGLIQEQKYGNRLLNQYKQSILLSAIIMLLAIGLLAFAKHPAIASLGKVTLIGMTCVVLMAFIVPPLLMKWKNKINLNKRINKLPSNQSTTN